jgi:uncharacterized protein YdiU (UPF0061 family)
MFGPCAFMDMFHPIKVFSSIGEFFRYAWDQHPVIALWNLTRFADFLLSLLDDDTDKAVDAARLPGEEVTQTFCGARWMARLKRAIHSW